MYRLDTIYSVTDKRADRQTETIIMPKIANSTIWSLKLNS